MKTLSIVLFGLLVIIAGGYIGICYSLSNRVLTPEGSNLDRVKNIIVEEWGTSFEALMDQMPKTREDFVVQGYDKINLAVKYFQKSDSSVCAIIFVHGWSELWAGMLKYVPTVAGCPCDYVFYDHRAHGDSEGKYPTAGINESKDLLMITDWVVKNKGFKRQHIAWYGSSWGAATSIIAGSSDTDVGLIIADAPFQDWYSAVFERAVKEYGSPIKVMSWGVMNIVNLRAGVDYKEASPVSVIAEVEEPVFLFHSKGDTSTNSQQSVNIAKNLNERSVFHHTDYGNVHVMDVVNNTADITMLLHYFIAREAPQFLASSDSTEYVVTQTTEVLEN